MLGLGYDEVKKINPGIIFCQIQGFGTGSKYETGLAFDMIAQAAGGTISVTGEPDRPPVKPGPSFGDTGTGMLMAVTILGALLERQRTGTGRRLQVAMQDAMIHYMRTCFATQARTGKAAPRRGAKTVAGTNSPSGLYQCKPLGSNDWIYITTSRGNPEHWGRLMKLIGREELIDDPRFATGAARVQHEAEVDLLVRCSLRAALAIFTLVVAGPAAARAQTPAETARSMLRQYQDDPARIDRARDLLEAAVVKGAGDDVPTLVALARAWFLYGEERAKTQETKIAAYERARDVAKRATALAPKDPDAHLWYAITLGTWSQAKGLLRSALALRDLRKEVDTVLRLDPSNIDAHIMAGSIARELPMVLGGDRKEAEEHFKTARRLDPRLTGARIELAQLYINIGRYQEARQELQAVLAERAPTDRARWTLKEAPRARQMLEAIRDKH